MASRPKRGKYLPMLPESDTESSVAEVEESESEESVRNASGNDENEAEDEEVDTALVEGEVIAARQRQLLLRQQQQRDEEEDADEEEGEEEEEEAEEGEDDEEGEEVDFGDLGEVEEEEFRPPPTPRMAFDRRHQQREATPLDIRGPQDFSKIYSELIDTCHELETDTGFDENFQNVMSRNIQRGHALFEHLIGQQQGSSTSDGTRRTMGGPGDMYLAFLHTKISSNIIRSRAERIGSGASIFSIESFLGSIKREYVDEDGDYNPKLAAANIAMQTSTGTKTLMPLVAVVGTFDRDAVTIPKSKKPRLPIRRPITEEQVDNSVDDTNPDNMQLMQYNSGAENLAKEMNKILKYHYRTKPIEPVNLFEFVLDRSSFSKTIENIFYLSFLVKDGHVSLTKEENGKFKELSLTVKPEKSTRIEVSSPDEGEAQRNQTHRQNYILSFSPRMWKSMSAMASGVDFFTFYQKVMEQHAHQHGAHPQKSTMSQIGVPALKFR